LDIEIPLRHIFQMVELHILQDVSVMDAYQPKPRSMPHLRQVQFSPWSDSQVMASSSK